LRRSRRGWLALEAAPADGEGHLSACASGGDALDPQTTTQVAATVRTVLPDLLYSLLTEAWLRKAPKPVAAEPAFRLLTGAVAARSTSIRTSAAREVCGSWTAPVGDGHPRNMRRRRRTSPPLPPPQGKPSTPAPAQGRRQRPLQPRPKKIMHSATRRPLPAPTTRRPSTAGHLPSNVISPVGGHAVLDVPQGP